ncbi:hypothetical protein VTJ83DRAFT_3709 [Remersonia thermophila]|uniref:Uncharacterized protein n=1 Tax=Remersonia thermophila TaxID=72144 RepID=A0ABR4DES3_9PEZI
MKHAPSDADHGRRPPHPPTRPHANESGQNLENAFVSLLSVSGRDAGGRRRRRETAATERRRAEEEKKQQKPSCSEHDSPRSGYLCFEVADPRPVSIVHPVPVAVRCIRPQLGER